MNRISLALCVALSSGTAFGQSFNIDFGGSGAGSSAPSSSFGAAAGQPGHWNLVQSTSPANVALLGLDGLATGVVLARATNGTFSSANSPATSGNHENLLDDYQSISSDTMVFTFNNLQQGKYVVLTYAADPASSANLATVNVPSSFQYCQVTQYTGGAIPTNAFRAGATHAVHVKTVVAGQPMIVNVAGSVGKGVVSGIQLVRLADEQAPVRLHVNDNAAGAGTGASWADAITDLQNALITADLGGGVSFEIWVAGGVYKPTAGTDRSATFKVAAGLKLYGGFAGSETDLAQRTAPLFNLTYLSGAIGGSGASDNSYTVVTLDSTNSNTLVDGFYIVSGNNTNNGRGGGMWITYGGGPEIRNCSFSSNSAALGGGAISAFRSSFRAVNCTFYNNQAPGGQGGAVESYGPIATTASMANCRFLGNSAAGGGGAVALDEVHGEMANCFFSGNTGGTGEGGAVRIDGASQTLKLYNCTLSKNSCGSSGGGVYASGGADVTINNSILWGNTSGAGGTTLQQQALAMSGHGSMLTDSYTTLQGRDADPKFVDADGPDNDPGNFDDNCRLVQGSPCIDAGSIALIPLDWCDVDNDGEYYGESLPMDFDLQARRTDIPWAPDTGWGTTPVIDRGAWEFRANKWCYANCDNSSIAPVLNVSDFVCFQTKYAQGDPYSNCDGSTVVPVLNVSDFVCFQTKYAAGCP